MFIEEFKERYTSIPFAVYRAYSNNESGNVISHKHREVELIAMTGGKANFFVDTKLYCLKKGDVLVIPPYSIHRAEMDGDMPVSYNCICFDLSLLWDEEVKTGFANHTLSVSGVIDANSSCAINVQQLIENGCKACESGSSGWELEAIGSMSIMFGILKKNGYFTSEIQSGGQVEFAQKVMNYINHNYFGAITSSTAAASLYMSNGYFCRTFKKTFGCCFSDYVLAFRLEKAKVFLINTSDKVTEISLKTGFNSCSYFIKSFKERFGISPLSYRKKESRK